MKDDEDERRAPLASPAGRDNFRFVEGTVIKIHDQASGMQEALSHHPLQPFELIHRGDV